MISDYGISTFTKVVVTSNIQKVEHYTILLKYYLYITGVKYLSFTSGYIIQISEIREPPYSLVLRANLTTNALLRPLQVIISTHPNLSGAAPC